MTVAKSNGKILAGALALLQGELCASVQRLALQLLRKLRTASTIYSPGCTAAHIWHSSTVRTCATQGCHGKGKSLCLLPLIH